MSSPLAVSKEFSRAGALAVAVMGAAVLLGWFLDVPFLTRLMPGHLTMKANTAFCFLAAGLALRVLQSRAANPWLRLARALALVVLAVGIVTLAEYLTGANWGIDQLLFHDEPQGAATLPPGRMAPATALSFVCIGLALLTTRWRPNSGALPRWLSVPALLIGALALVGYAYGVNSLYVMGPYIGMALYTGAGFFLLSLAIVAAHPADGFMEVLTSDTTGGISARRLLPVTTLILFSLGWICLAGRRAGLYDTSFGLALMVYSSIIVTSCVVAWHASLLHRADLMRRGVEAQILALNASLEQRVHDRTRKLEEALAEVRQLGELLPMCSWCNRIRDDRDYWHSVEGYVSARTGTRFTHAMCPECRDKVLQDDLTAG